jgi:hypothetical protein
MLMMQINPQRSLFTLPEPEQESVTERVIKVYDYLIEKGIVKNAVEFTRAIEVNYFSFAQVKLGTRSFPEEHLRKLEKTYYINHDYLTKGKLPMFKDQPVSVKRVECSGVEVIKERGKVVVNYVVDGRKHRVEYVRK